MTKTSNESITATDPVIAEISHLGELQILTTTDPAELRKRVEIIEDALAVFASVFSFQNGILTESAIKRIVSPVLAEHESTEVEHPNIWTTGGPDDHDLIHLAVPLGHHVYLACN
jgi:hypothetical protein